MGLARLINVSAGTWPAAGASFNTQHGCEPNTSWCEPQYIVPFAELPLKVIRERHIKFGEEITVSYGSDYCELRDGLTADW